jgi:hypothetical protein
LCPQTLDYFKVVSEKIEKLLRKTCIEKTFLKGLVIIIIIEKKRSVVYIFKHMIKAYLNSEIGIKMCVIKNNDKLKCILLENQVIYFPKIIGVLAP